MSPRTVTRQIEMALIYLDPPPKGTAMPVFELNYRLRRGLEQIEAGELSEPELSQLGEDAKRILTLMMNEGQFESDSAMLRIYLSGEKQKNPPVFRGGRLMSAFGLGFTNPDYAKSRTKTREIESKWHQIERQRARLSADPLANYDQLTELAEQAKEVYQQGRESLGGRRSRKPVAAQ